MTLDEILESLHRVGPGSDWEMVNGLALRALIKFAREASTSAGGDS